jgi:hypothetical protein
MSNNFWTPKSVFKGNRADGSKYKVEEWDFNSIGNLGGGFLASLLASALIMVIASPLALILAIFTYNGRIGIPNVIGVIIGLYFCIDASYGWIGSSLTNLFLSGSQMSFMVALNIASLFAHVVLIIITLYAKEKLNVFPMMWVLLIFMCYVVYRGYGIGKNVTSSHGSYRHVAPELELK